ncbi:MAG: Holliday junction branch migration DNA helicase RuvB [Chloroflexota bacterium]|nr:Holliday junction branch migration DNA helicase RuvB [Chloroflexota bacterium]
MAAEERAIDGALQDDEELQAEQTLRPQRLGDFPGQDRVKEVLVIAIEAAKKRGEPLDHHLFYGPPGLGKTTLAHILAAEMNAPIRTTSGPAIERPGDLAAILTNLKEGEVLFIDEIHRLARAVEEILYPAMEDFAIDLVIGKGPGARSIRLQLPNFTVIGATTRYAMISAPLRDRFGSVYRLDFYELDALTTIVRRSAGLLGIDLAGEAAEEIAKRARGTPRVANRILRRVRDYVEVRAGGVATLEATREAIDLLEVDALGLDVNDRRLLRALVEQFEGGPVGLETIAAAISEESDTVFDVYEPFLLKRGLLKRTPRGRMATAAAWRHLGIDPPATPGASSQGELWGEPDVDERLSLNTPAAHDERR